MAERPTIFVSAVSGELRSFRQAVRDVLWAKDVFPVVQDSFPTDYREVRAMLTEKIKKSDAVICVIGFAYGAEPHTRPDNEPRRSYSQLEYHLARELQKPVYTFLTDDDVRPCDAIPNEEDDCRRLQLAHRKSIRDSDKLWHQFAIIEELKTKVALIPIVSQAGFKISSGHLLHGAYHLFGRESELAVLDQAWSDPAKHVLTIVAWGGVGKTSLVVEWMARKSAANWFGFDRVFDWSFSSQGTHEPVAASADTFIATALEFFGDAEFAHSGASPWDKGSRLAHLVAQRHTLLVLDGLEPLQHPPGPLAGQLKDPALGSLLQCLARHNLGLCLVTTRETVTDLAPFHNTTAPELELQHLSTLASVELLKTLGVRGPESEFNQLIEDVKGHALTLNLLGRYLAKAHQGDICRRDRVQFEKADAKLQGGQAFKTISAYEKWMNEGGEDGARCLALLRLQGLFDRPADAGCLAVLRLEPAIVGLTEPLVGLDDDDWNLTLSYLADCGLISVQSDQSVIDVHPLIREYFAKQLRGRSPEAWRSAHRRLYEYLKTSTPDKDEPTLEDLQPLYQAVAHGCLAGSHSEVYNSVYLERIKRAQSINRLGAVGAELGAVACFFDQPWNRAVSGLTTQVQNQLLTIAGFSLTSLSRFDEAQSVMQANLKLSLAQNDWEEAAKLGNYLSELKAVLGDLRGAVSYAENAVKYADQAQNLREKALLQVEQEKFKNPNFALESVWPMFVRATLACAFMQSGDFSKALRWFHEAMSERFRSDRARPILAAIKGAMIGEALVVKVERAAWQCILSPSPGRVLFSEDLVSACQDVEAQTTQSLKCALDSNILLIIGKNHLMLGCIALYRAVLMTEQQERARELGNASHQLNTAVKYLRRSGRRYQIPPVLLSLAWFRHLNSDADGARTDLDEAWQIADRGPMRLHMIDIHLHRARLFYREKPYPWKSPQDDLAAARQLIEQCGYWRRKDELEDAEEAAKLW